VNCPIYVCIVIATVLVVKAPYGNNILDPIAMSDLRDSFIMDDFDSYWIGVSHGFAECPW
jgi:hypothetical protein